MMKTSLHISRKTDAKTAGKFLRKPLVIGVVEVGREPNSLALAANDCLALVCNTEDRTLSLIDTDAMCVIAVIALPIRPLAIVVDARRNRAYVGGLGQSKVIVVDISARKIVGEIAASEGHAMTIDTRSQRLYVHANSAGNGQLCIIDTASDRLLKRFITGPFASAAVLSRDGRLFICDYLRHALNVLDSVTGEITTVLSLPDPFEEFALSPAGDFGYAPYRTDERIVAKIDLASYDVVDLLPVPPLPHGLTFSPNGALACCCSAAERNVTIIDTATWQVVSRFQAGLYPQSPVFSADGTRLYLCDSFGNAVWVVALD